MIRYILTIIKGWFKPNRNKDEHLVLYEDMPESEVPVYKDEKAVKAEHCGTHNRFRKSCPNCLEAIK